MHIIPADTVLLHHANHGGSSHTCVCVCAFVQAAHVAQNEEGCLAYELSINTDDPDSFIIYERWVMWLPLPPVLAAASQLGPSTECTCIEMHWLH